MPFDQAVMDDNAEVDRVLLSMRGGLILDNAGRAGRAGRVSRLSETNHARVGGVIFPCSAYPKRRGRLRRSKSSLQLTTSPSS